MNVDDGLLGHEDCDDLELGDEGLDVLLDVGDEEVPGEPLAGRAVRRHEELLEVPGHVGPPHGRPVYELGVAQGVALGDGYGVEVPPPWGPRCWAGRP